MIQFGIFVESSGQIMNHLDKQKMASLEECLDQTNNAGIHHEPYQGPTGDPEARMTRPVRQVNLPTDSAGNILKRLRAGIINPAQAVTEMMVLGRLPLCRAVSMVANRQVETNEEAFSIWAHLEQSAPSPSLADLILDCTVKPSGITLH